MMRKYIQTDAYNRRLSSSTREVLLAVALTIAALVFIFAVSQPPAPQAPERIGDASQRVERK